MIMGLLSELKNKFFSTHATKEPKQVINDTPKERIITPEDMERFSGFRYQLNCDIITDHGYNKMVLNKNNQFEALTDITYMNNFLKEARMLAPLPLLEICTEEIDFLGNPEQNFEGMTHLELKPYTKTGKISKYPVILHYYTTNYTVFDSTDNYFGHISYLQDGSIGKAKLICWEKNKLFIIQLGLIGTTLAIKRIETNSKSGAPREILYKHN